MQNEMKIETIECHGQRIEIGYDCDPINPREDFDNLSTFAFFHRDFKNESDILSSCHNSLEDIRKYLEKEYDAICVPVYAYIHSGVALNTTGFSCPWDSGQLGFAYVTKEKAREWFSWKLISKKRKEQLKEYLEGEVEIYNQYINGEVYCYEVYDREGDLIDSCYGYFGKDDCIGEAIQVAKNHDMVA